MSHAHMWVPAIIYGKTSLNFADHYIYFYSAWLVNYNYIPTVQKCINAC